MKTEEIKALIGEVKDRLQEIEKLMAEQEPLRIEKIAVKVNNEREFKILMEHYDSLGWFNCEGERDSVYYFNQEGVIEVTYNDGYSYICKGSAHQSHSEIGYTVIDFDFFCAQKGIQVPKFIMNSVDGFPIYENDPYYLCAHNDKKGWYFHDGFKHAVPMIGHASTTMSAFKSPDKYKAFSTKEAAEAWIEEQRPKKINIHALWGEVEVTDTTVSFKIRGEFQCISGTFFDRIVNARTKLNGGQ